MPNEFHIEIAFDTEWVNQCLSEKPDKIVVSGVFSIAEGTCTNDITLKGMKDGKYLAYAVAGCPMPCTPPARPSGG